MTARHIVRPARARHDTFWAFAAGLTAIVLAAPSKAEPFELRMFLQNGPAISAIGLAVSQLSGCQEDLGFSQTKRKDNDGSIITVAVTCRKLLGDDGKTSPASIQIEFELEDDGNVGPPIAFIYD